MKLRILFSIFVGFSVMQCFASVDFIGNALPVIKEVPEASTGLNNIYVLYTTAGVSATYTSTSNSVPKWYKFGQMGGGYAEEITDITYDGSISKLNSVTPNSGYIIEDGSKREYFWVVDYAQFHPLSIDAIYFNDVADCDVMTVNLQGSGDEISYYTINGQHKVLSRDILLHYNTLQWDADNKKYVQQEVQKTIDYIKPTIATQVPLCNTIFYMSGDKFLKTWNMETSAQSGEYVTHAIEVQGTAEQTNATEASQTTLGGSAPADITFTSYCTDAVVFKEWQISSDAEFEKILYKFNEGTIDYTFNEAGTFYVRFYGANSDASCESWSETFEVSIGESSLKCPNAFSPQSSEGVNDIWKVSYKSIISFECHIFNRWGIEMISFSDPSAGWDGKYKGKYVDSGVYFYVIQAKGADGRNYKLKGDINIINLKK